MERTGRKAMKFPQQDPFSRCRGNNLFHQSVLKSGGRTGEGAGTSSRYHAGGLPQRPKQERGNDAVGTDVRKGRPDTCVSGRRTRCVGIDRGWTGARIEQGAGRRGGGRARAEAGVAGAVEARSVAAWICRADRRDNGPADARAASMDALAASVLVAIGVSSMVTSRLVRSTDEQVSTPRASTAIFVR